MEAFDRKNDIVLFFDFFSQGSQDLYNSFINSKIEVEAVCINDDGFLPDGVVNPFEWFCGDFSKCDKIKGKPLYFNEVPIPDFWEISGTNSEGRVKDFSRDCAKIFYAEPKHKRYVKVVDWLDENGVARFCDHFNKYGAFYARTTLNKDGKRVFKTYFDVNGRDVVVENFVTGGIILNEINHIQMFKNRTEFLAYFMKKAGFDKKRLFFNSLSTPFFVSNALSQNEAAKGDILFWQEPIYDSIPGNMRYIFDGKATRCAHVIVQDLHSYEKLIGLGVKADMLSKLGFVYSFEKENTGKPKALICTNTENVEKLAKLATDFPDMHFYVAALTEMSAKLMAHEQYKNVHLYPNVSMKELENLFKRCDFYLDINHEGEIVDALRRAFINKQLILAFEETTHNKRFVCSNNIYAIAGYENFKQRLQKLMQDKAECELSLNEQLQQMLAVSGEVFNSSIMDKL